MPIPWAAAAAGASIASTIGGTIAGMQANKDAKKAIQQQAAFTYDTRMEQVRRDRLQQNQIVGENVARVGASNILMSGSAKQHLDMVRSEFARDLAWQRLSAAKEREATLAGTPGKSANIASLLGGASSIAGTLMNYHRPTGG